MNHSMLFRAAISALALLLIASCGGGGSSGPQVTASATAAAPTDTTGVVGILLTDAPSDDYTRIMMRITEVQLLGNGAPQTVFAGDLVFDLLSLRNHSNLLSLSDAVAVGDYDKIRLRVESITLYYLDELGDEQSVDVRVPANGKVDLNPRGTFTVSADSALLIQIDLDAKKSIHIVGTGNGSHRFRPVVFVEIDEHAIPSGLLRVSGVVGNINDDPSAFELCELDDVHVDTPTDGCIAVNVDERTSFFDAEGQPTTPNQLTQGERVTVFARAIVVPIDEGDAGDDGDNADDDTIGMVQLAAYVVHQGAPADLLSLDGTARSTVDEADRFEFEVMAGQELEEGTINVQLHDETRILSGNDLSDLTPDAIEPGLLTEVSGMVQPGLPEDPTSLSAALVLIRGDQPSAGLTELEGTVVGVDTETFTLFAENEQPPGDRCVAPVDDAHYLTVMVDAEDGADHEEVDADYLDVGQEVTVYGAYAESGDCFEADTIIIDETGSVD